MKELNLKHMKENLDIFLCPRCGGNLLLNFKIRCEKCNIHYYVENGIPLLFHKNEWPDSKRDVTKMIKAFYEKTPFPNYNEIETVSDLIQRAERRVFAKILDQQIPFNTKILEVGCGTGHLTNYLGIAHRFLFGVDISLNSLKLAHNFKMHNDLKRVGFYQMNLFEPIFKEESFHLVICNGVLHHTSNPFKSHF